jgi:hypothetical protein
MYVKARTLIVVLGFLFSACGSSPASDNKYATGATCTPGATTIPRATDDPCKQDGTPCGMSGGTGQKMCSAEGKWGDCICVLPQTQTPPPVTTPASKCGDGVIDAASGEQCEQGMTAASCTAMLGPTATGVVMCVNCKYDASMCHLPAAAPTAGMGASTGGAGSGM